jgi:hypothetical protein
MEMPPGENTGSDEEREANPDHTDILDEKRQRRKSEARPKSHSRFPRRLLR